MECTCEPHLHLVYMLGAVQCSCSTQQPHFALQVLQLGMGSGFKCCSAVWKALRHINTKHSCWEFRDRHA